MPSPCHDRNDGQASRRRINLNAATTAFAVAASPPSTSNLSAIARQYTGLSNPAIGLCTPIAIARNTTTAQPRIPITCGPALPLRQLAHHGEARRVRHECMVMVRLVASTSREREELTMAQHRHVRIRHCHPVRHRLALQSTRKAALAIAT